MKADPVTQAKSQGQLLALASVTAVAQNGAFEVGFDFRQRLEQQINSLSSDQLTGEKDHVAGAEIGQQRFVTPNPDWNAQLDAARFKTIPNQFLFQIV